MQPIRGETPAGCAKVSGGNWALVVSSLMFTLAIVLPSLTKLRARGKTFPPIGCQSVSVLDEGSRTRVPVLSRTQISLLCFRSFSISTQVSFSPCSFRFALVCDPNREAGFCFLENFF